MSRCAACGRRLRRPSPSGLGPVCARRLGAATSPPAKLARTPSTTDPVPVVPGQTELPIEVDPAV